MATHLGLGQALRVMRSDVSRNGVGNWRKETLVDIIVSLAFATRAIPGVQEHLEAAHKIALASPAHGGGIEAAMKHLNGVVPQLNNATVDYPGDKDPNMGVDDRKSEDSAGPSASGTTCDTDVVDTSSRTSLSPVRDNSKSQSHDIRTKACRSAYSGFKCLDVTCDRYHPATFCHLSTCYPRRDPNCSDWHPRAWSRHQGNGKWGVGRPKPKANDRSKNGNNKGNNHNNRSHGGTVRKLEQKLVRTQAALTTEKQVKSTYKQILLSSQQAPSMAQLPVMADPNHRSVSLTQPGVQSKTTGGASAPALPGDLSVILAALARALAAAGFPSK